MTKQIGIYGRNQYSSFIEYAALNTSIDDDNLLWLPWWLQYDTKENMGFNSTVEYNNIQKRHGEICAGVIPYVIEWTEKEHSIYWFSIVLKIGACVEGDTRACINKLFFCCGKLNKTLNI